MIKEKGISQKQLAEDVQKSPSKMIYLKEEEITIDANLGNALASISYATSRGILMTRFQGTALEDFILPVIDPNDLLE